MTNLKKHYKAISILLLLISIVPYIHISFFSRPCADDYFYSIEMIRMVERGENGFFSVLKTAWQTNMHFYYSWNGLFASGFLQSLQPGAYLGEQNYFLGALAIFLIIFLGLYYFIKTLFEVFRIGIRPLFPACILFSYFVHGMVSPTQGFYWFCGAVDYIPFFILILINVSLIMKYFLSDNKNTLYLLLSCVVSAINAGGNHITSFLNIIILTVFSIISIIQKKKRGVLIPLLIAIVGFLFVVFAPGTSARMKTVVGSDLITTITATIKRALILFKSRYYTFNPRFIVYIVFLTLLSSLIKDNHTIKSLGVHPITLFLIFAMFFCEMLAVPYYAMTTFGAGRMKNIDWMAFNILIGLLYIYTLIWLSDRYPAINRILERVGSFDKRILIIISCILLIAFSKNMYSIVNELRDGTAQRFADQYEERYELMKKKRDSDEVVVLDPIIESPNLKFDDLTDDINDLRNVWWYQYYKVKTIVESKENN